MVTPEELGEIANEAIVDYIEGEHLSVELFPAEDNEEDQEI